MWGISAPLVVNIILIILVAAKLVADDAGRRVLDGAVDQVESAVERARFLRLLKVRAVFAQLHVQTGLFW